MARSSSDLSCFLTSVTAVPAAGRKLAPGLAVPSRSKTPTAEIERSAYRTSGHGSPHGPSHKVSERYTCRAFPACLLCPFLSATHFVQVSSAVGYNLPQGGGDEAYSAENLRRIARSLSSNFPGGRPDHLTTSHSFVSQCHANMHPNRQRYIALCLIISLLCCAYGLLSTCLEYTPHGVIVSSLSWHL